MPTRSDGPDPPLPERPIAESYWVVPGRLLVGEYPGSPSRAEAMERLVWDENLRGELSRKAIEQAAKFTWEKTARQTLAVFESLSQYRAR